MIGYMIEQELGNLLPFEVPFATLLTMIEVDAEDPGFKNPTKFVGPVYDKSVADWVAQEKGWVFKADGDTWRRVVPSPEPKRIFEIRPIRWLLEKGVIVIAAALPGIALGCLLAQQAPAQDRPSPTVSNRYIPAPAERLGSLEQQKAYSYRNRLSAQQRSMELDRALNRNQRIWRAFVSESAYGSGSIWFPKQVTCITLPMPG